MVFFSGRDTSRGQARVSVRYAVLIVLSVACAGAAAVWYWSANRDSWPDPYEGFTHSRPEHGYWRQLKSGEESADGLIGELHLHDDGFSVTWAPIETYKDYWGTYALDEQNRQVVFKIESGNHIPTDFRDTGTLTLKSPDRLLLEGVWLGSLGPNKRVQRGRTLFQRFAPRKE
jgi:hypothetical protein